MKQGIILFAHGSRDPGWSRPFKRIAAALSKNTKFLVRVAFLERMRPTLAEALTALAAKKISSVRVVPLFLGAGGHVKRDLPKLVAAANPSMKVSIDPPIGEQAAVIKAIAAVISKRGGRASP
ncbi:MAG TPA: CbiX/SirB N-terminal domain-containing protein [Burkholderiales bacterium]